MLKDELQSKYLKQNLNDPRWSSTACGDKKKFLSNKLNGTKKKKRRKKD